MTPKSFLPFCVALASAASSFADGLNLGLPFQVPV